MPADTEKFAGKLQEQTAGTAFQLVWGTVGRIGRFISDQEAMQRGMQIYAQRFLERYGQIKVLGMSRPVPLLSIYTAARVVSSRFLYEFRSPEELEYSFLKRSSRDSFRTGRKEPSSPALDLANKEQFLNVLGAPGAGKSTFLRRLGLEALLPRSSWNDSLLSRLGLTARLDKEDVSKYQHEQLPVLIELRRFKTEEVNIPKIIEKELAICGMPRSGELVDTLLKEGRLLLLLDGIDEIPGDKLEEAILHIGQFADQYSNNWFVISCRTAFYKNHFNRFTDVVLADFDDEQVSNFVRNWFHPVDERQVDVSEEFLQLLNSPENAAAKELASTPLLLTFLCLTYDDRQELPHNRSVLYREALEILLRRWAAEKRVHNAPIYRELHGELEKQMLSEIAAPAFMANRYFFSRKELIEAIANFIRNELNAPKHLDGDSVLDAIEIQQGLIVQRARDIYSFSHLTLQEFLAAEWYVSNQRVGELIENRLLDERWHEVLLLAAGRVGRADELLRRLLDAAESKLQPTPDVVGFLNWIENAVVVTGEEQEDAARRAIAFSIALAVKLNLVGMFVGARTRASERAHDVLFTRSLGLAAVLARGDKKYFNFFMNGLLAWNSVDGPVSFSNYINKYFLPIFQEVDASRCLKCSLGPVFDVVRNFMRAVSGSSSSRQLQLLDAQVQGALSEALGLPQGSIFKSVESRQSMQDYLELCGLVLDCRRSATSVSQSGWNSICARMFVPAAASANERASAIR